MIHVTRLHGEEMVVNADLIEFIEATPDTILSLVTGRKVMVRETVDQVVQRVVEFESAIRVRGGNEKRVRLVPVAAGGEEED